MKDKINLALAAGLLLSAQAALATDLSSNFSFNNGVKIYGGAGAGYSTQGSACNTPFVQGSCDEGSMGYKVFGGVRFNPMLGAEVAYVDHGDAELNGTAGSQSVASKNQVSGYQVTGVGYLPIAPDTLPNLELVGKAGALFWKRETRMEMNDAVKDTSDNGISPLIGIGAQYQFHQNMSLRGEWEHAISTGADSDFETDINNYSMSIMYSTL
ncbi:MAG: outer membrane beta-barrel protein [Thiolinea sp.]